MDKQSRLDHLSAFALEAGFKLHEAHLISIAAENMSHGDLRNSVEIVLAWINERESA